MMGSPFTMLLFLLISVSSGQTPDTEGASAGLSADSALKRGLSLAQSGQMDAAKNTFRSARRSYPLDARFPLELAGIAYRQSDTPQAKRLLLTALRMDPRNEYGNSFLGALFLLDGNLPAALKFWNRIHKPLLQGVHLQPVPPLDTLLRDRALWISGGQVLSARRLEMSTANLDRLAVFSSYQFELSPAGNERYDLTFRSLPRRFPAGRWLALLPLARGLPYETVFVDFHNLRQRAIHFDSLIRWDSNKKRVSWNLAAPWRLSPRWIWQMGFDARDEDWDLTQTYFSRQGGIDGLLMRKASLEAGIAHGLTSRLQWTFQGKSSFRSFRNGDAAPFFRNGWAVELPNGLGGNLWSRPENRMKVNGGVSLRTGHLYSRPPSHYTGVAGNAHFVWLPGAKGDDLVVSSSVHAGRLFGIPPFDELYTIGMERDNEIWMRGHVGTRNGRKGSAPLGTEYGIVQTEVDRTVLRLPLVRLQLGPFLDTGRVGDRFGAFGHKGWMVDAGVQAKVKVLGAFTWAFVYGRDLRNGRGAFYTAVLR